MPSLALLLLTSLASAACDGPTDAATLQTYVTSADQAYEQLDLARFTASAQAAAEAAPCLAEPLTPALAASLHRTAGIAAFAERDPDLAEKRFAAARDAVPDYDFPTTMVPEGHPLRTHYTAVDLSTVPVLPVTPAAAGAVLLDGANTAVRRDGLPVFFQRVEADGVVSSTRLLGPATALPPYPRAPERLGRSKPSPLPIVLLATGALLAVGGTAFALGQRGGVCESPIGSCEPKPDKTRAEAENANSLITPAVTIAVVGGVAMGAGVALTFALPKRGE